MADLSWGLMQFINPCGLELMYYIVRKFSFFNNSGLGIENKEMLQNVDDPYIWKKKAAKKATVKTS